MPPTRTRESPAWVLSSQELDFNQVTSALSIWDRGRMQRPPTPGPLVPLCHQRSECQRALHQRQGTLDIEASHVQGHRIRKDGGAGADGEGL